MDMADDNLKGLKDLLEKTIKPLRDELALVSSKVRSELRLVHPRIDMIAARQELTNDKLDKQSEVLEDHGNRLDAIGVDVETLLDKTKALRDGIGLWHQRDKREINEIKKHVGLPLIPDIPE